MVTHHKNQFFEQNLPSSWKMHSVFCAMATAAERKAKSILEFQALADSDSKATLLEYWLYTMYTKRHFFHDCTLEATKIVLLFCDTNLVDIIILFYIYLAQLDLLILQYTANVLTIKTTGLKIANPAGKICNIYGKGL